MLGETGNPIRTLIHNLSRDLWQWLKGNQVWERDCSAYMYTCTLWSRDNILQYLHTKNEAFDFLTITYLGYVMLHNTKSTFLCGDGIISIALTASLQDLC